MREFRVHHHELEAALVAVAGVSREAPESNLHWAKRLELPYPLLSDRDGEAARALGVMRPLKIAGWTLELMRRITILIDAKGTIAATWSKVHVRGHAREILETALRSGST